MCLSSPQSTASLFSRYCCLVSPIMCIFIAHPLFAPPSTPPHLLTPSSLSSCLPSGVSNNVSLSFERAGLLMGPHNSYVRAEAAFQLAVWQNDRTPRVMPAGSAGTVLHCTALYCTALHCTSYPDPYPSPCFMSHPLLSLYKSSSIG